MANAWFRMYSEFADDPKVQMMPEAMQRRLAMLMCSRCKDETLHETERAFHWRISETDLAETKALFIQKGFMDEGWNLLNWNKRQFLSDSSTERVRKHRQAMKQDGTLQKSNGTPRNASVTAPDTEQNRTEAETDHKENAQMVARRLREETDLKDYRIGDVLMAVAEGLLGEGKTLDETFAQMRDAWGDYQKQCVDLRYTWNAQVFFGQGHWKNPAAWPRKKEKPPEPEPKKPVLTLLERKKQQEERSQNVLIATD